MFHQSTAICVSSCGHLPQITPHVNPLHGVYQETEVMTWFLVQCVILLTHKQNKAETDIQINTSSFISQRYIELLGTFLAATTEVGM